MRGNLKTKEIRPESGFFSDPESDDGQSSVQMEEDERRGILRSIWKCLPRKTKIIALVIIFIIFLMAFGSCTFYLGKAYSNSRGNRHYTRVRHERKKGGRGHYSSSEHYNSDSKDHTTQTLSQY